MKLVSDILRLPYTDNDAVTVADRLAAEIESDPSRLWVASGYFAVSVWPVLSSALEKLGDFRLLLGKSYELAGTDVSREEQRIADLVDQALRAETERPRLPLRSEARDVAELMAFLRKHRDDGKPVVKLWSDREFLHAKAYLLTGSVGIGSANFTGNGLTKNRELVGWRQDRPVVDEVAAWFKGLWESENACDYTDELLEILGASPLVSDEYTPHDVLMRVLAARYGVEAPPELERAGFTLKWFQEDAAFRVIRLLDGPARGALLADAVGLGKTYVALRVIEHYLYRRAGERRGRGKPVLLIVPASLREMWGGLLERLGLDWACRMVTTQTLRREFSVADYAGHDLIVIDEAHRLRGGSVWFRKVTDLVTTGERADEKRVLLLTATPVNTSMTDLVRLLQVLTKNRRSVWAPDIADFERYLKRVDGGQADPFPVLDRSIVRRSRSDILRAQEEAKQAGIAIDEVKLPKRRLAHVAYDYGDDGDLFDQFAQALRSLALAPYDLERYRRDADEDADGETIELFDPLGRVVDAEDAGVRVRPGTLAALCAVGLLVRFQSSLEAIRISLRRLDAVLRRFGEALDSDPPVVLDLKSSRDVQRLLRRESRADADEADVGASGDNETGALGAAGEPCEVSGVSGDEVDEGSTAATELDAEWERVFATLEPLPDAASYDTDAIRGALAADRALVASLLALLPASSADGKIRALLGSFDRPARDSKQGAPGLCGCQTLLFTQFRDTAVYVADQLAAHGLQVARIDGGVDPDVRAAITGLFDPERAEALSMERQAAGEAVPQVLVSTDVLAEGHNLQLADTVINFDLHFNPQVAVQRAGRIDRINSPHGQVNMVSFLPPEDLNRHIGLLARLDERFRRIHGLGLGDESTTTLAADQQALTLEQVRRLYADDASVLDEVERSWTLGSTDYMRQPLQAFLSSVGKQQIDAIPFGVTSVKRLPREWRKGAGAFLAFAGPPPREGNRDTFWRFYGRNDDGSWGSRFADEVELFKAIVCRQGEPRAEVPWRVEGPTVIDWDLLRRAADELAAELTEARATAEVARGASERSRKLRLRLRANLAGLEVDGADALLDRLLQVRVEDYDGRTGWRSFVDAERALAKSSPEARHGLAQKVVGTGLELLGPPVAEDESPERVVVLAEDLQLVAYEVLLPSEDTVVAAPDEPQQLFGTGG